MHFLIYTKYRFTNLLKTKSFVICLFLYYLLLSAFLYIIPFILKISYVELFSYRTILIMINLVLVMAIIFSGIFLFKQGYEDGSELILQSKPLSKSIIVWGKIFIVFLISILISLIQIIETSFTAIIISDKNLLNGIMLGSFLSPFITTLFWSSVSIIFCYFFKKTTILLAILGINGVLGILNLITSLVGTKPYEIIKDNKMDYVTLKLFDEKTKQITKTQAIAITNNLPINNDSLINGVSLNQLGYTTSNILEKSWNNAYKDSTIAETSYSNLIGLLNSFYYVNINNFSELKYENEYKELITLDTYYYLNFKPSQIDKNDLTKININDGSIFLSIINNDFKINSLFDNEKISLPFNDFDTSTNNYSIKQFNDLDDFNQTFFNKNEIKKATEYQKFLKSAINKKWGSNIGNYYLNIFSSYLATKYNVNFNNYKTNKTYINELNKLTTYFQYNVFKLLQKYFNNELINVDDEIVKIWLAIMNQNNINSNLKDFSISDIKFNINSTAQILVWNAKDNYELMNNLQQKNPNELSGIIFTKDLYLKLISNKHMETLSDISIKTVYDFVILIPICIIISTLTIIGATSIMLNKDVI